MRIVITGDLHSGKSTIVNKIRKKYSHRVIGGFLTCPVIKNKQKKGYCIKSIEGDREIFAHVDFDKQITFGSMGIKLAVFNHFAVDILKQSLMADLIIIDELGIMEKGAVRFVEQMGDIFRKAKNIIVVIQKRVINFWIPRIGKKNIDVEYLVTPENRDIILESVSIHLQEQCL